ncbi:MAG: hypothetical protein M3391_11860 [Actinomycetota bacterium]|nr:hypothetical protein [Actinomycetota bacterium]
MKRRLLIPMLAIVILIVPLAARASHLDLKDANDASGPLDVQEVGVWGSSPPRWRIFTYNGWSNAQLWDQGYIAIYFDTYGPLKGKGSRYDYYALLSSNGHRMRGLLFRDFRSRSDVRIGKLRTRKPGRRTVIVKVPVKRKMQIGEARAVYKWYVKTISNGTGCGHVCMDRVPDDGGVAEPLRPNGPAS